jgi:hypothetical protein
MQHEFLFIVTNSPSLHASLMDIRNDTSFRSILEDDSISSVAIQSPHLFLFRQGGGVMLDCWAIYTFIPHCKLYFHVNITFLSQFDLAFNI